MPELPPFAGNGLLFCPIGQSTIIAINDRLHPPVTSKSIEPAGRELDVYWTTAITSAAALLIVLAIVLARWRSLIALICLLLFTLTVVAWFRSAGGAEEFVGQRILGRKYPFLDQTTRGVISSRDGLTFGTRHTVWEASARRPTFGGNLKGQWL
jgi:hypothetical protein